MTSLGCLHEGEKFNLKFSFWSSDSNLWS